MGFGRKLANMSELKHKRFADGMKYLTAAEIFDYLKKQIGSSLKVNSLMGFGRKLANMSELKHKRFADGMKHLVKKK